METLELEQLEQLVSVINSKNCWSSSSTSATTEYIVTNSYVIHIRNISSFLTAGKVGTSGWYSSYSIVTQGTLPSDIKNICEIMNGNTFLFQADIVKYLRDIIYSYDNVKLRYYVQEGSYYSKNMPNLGDMIMLMNSDYFEIINGSKQYLVKVKETEKAIQFKYIGCRKLTFKWVAKSLIKDNCVPDWIFKDIRLM